MIDYAEFLRGKAAAAVSTGFEPAPMGAYLAPFQGALTRWALRRGRAAVFAATGLGKTRIELEWARQIAALGGGPVLILAPLAVAAQTVREARALGIAAEQSRDGRIDAPIVVTNYDMLDRFDARAFAGVALDESSILKAFDGATRTKLIETFAATPYRLAATATPAPNDFTELGNHAEFLGVMRRSEMLSQYFVHDGGSTQDWRLKGHAREAFWRWVCSWGALVQKPSDLGFPDDGYELPPLRFHEHIMPAGDDAAREQGRLFAASAHGLSEQRNARRKTLDERVRVTADLVRAEPDEIWIIWCELNDESAALAEACDATEVTGSNPAERKEETLLAFAEGRIRRLVSKPSICGFGLNWQHCARMAMGASNSFEQTYQAIRRCWRFGQRREVHVHIVCSELDRAVLENQRRKEAEAATMAAEMSRFTRAFVQAEVRGVVRETLDYNAEQRMALPRWLEG